MILETSSSPTEGWLSERKASVDCGFFGEFVGLTESRNPSPGSRYRIPHGGFFDYATQAVYFCESLGNCGDSLEVELDPILSQFRQKAVRAVSCLISLPDILKMGEFQPPNMESKHIKTPSISSHHLVLLMDGSWWFKYQESLALWVPRSPGFDQLRLWTWLGFFLLSFPVPRRDRITGSPWLGQQGFGLYSLILVSITTHIYIYI